MIDRKEENDQTGFGIKYPIFATKSSKKNYEFNE